MSKSKKWIIGIICVFVLFWIFSGGEDQIVANQMQKIENQVAEDAVAQYNIAKEHGDKMDAYVHAGMVAAAYLQAKDQENYKKWKAIEKEEAKNAGMSDALLDTEQ